MGTEIPEMDEITLFLERDESWIQDAGTVDTKQVNTWSLYRAAFNSVRLSRPRMALHLIRDGREIIPASRGLRSRSGLVEE